MTFYRLVYVALVIVYVGCDKKGSDSSDSSDPASESTPNANDGGETEESSALGSLVISGEITFPDGAPATGTEIYVVGKSEPVATVGANGALAIVAEDLPNSALNLAEPSYTLYGIGEQKSKRFGFQIKDVKPGKDTPADIGTKKLAKLGSIVGSATRSGKEDNTGVDFYVPGTSFLAKTDAKGGVSLGGIPPGQWDIRVESDGYRPVDFAGITVGSDETTTVPAIVLFPSTGVHANVIINDGEEATSSREVDVTILYSPNATIYRFGSDANFSNVDWEPVTGPEGVKFKFTFSDQGEQTLYVEIQDADGTASTKSATILVDLFPAAASALNFGSGVTSSSSQTVNITFTHPQNATEFMICNNATFEDCVWQPVKPSLSHDFGADGDKVYIKYRDGDGFESTVFETNFLVDSQSPALTIDSHRDREILPSSPGATQISGTCESGLDVAISLTGPATSAATTSCVENRWNLTLNYSANTEIELRSSQTDAAGNTASQIRRLFPEQMSLADAFGGSSEVFYADGTKTYVLMQSGRLDVYDTTTNPPERIGTTAIPGSMHDVDKVGNYLIITWGSGNPSEFGLVTVNISTPSNPTVADSDTQTNSSFGNQLVGKVSGNNAYVGLGDELLAYDITDPTAISLTHNKLTYSGDDEIRWLHEYTGYLYVVIDRKLLVLDMASMALGADDSTDLDDTNHAVSSVQNYYNDDGDKMAAYQDHVYSHWTGGGSNVYVVRFTGAALDESIHFIAEPWAGASSTGLAGLFVQGDRLVMTRSGGTDNLKVYDLSSDIDLNPGVIDHDGPGTAIANLSSPQPARFSWGYVFKDTSGNPQGIDLSTPATPAAINYTVPSNGVNAGSAFGDYACTGSGPNQLIFKVDSSNTIAHYGTLNVMANDCSIVDDVAWLALTGSDETKLYDLRTSSLNEITTLSGRLTSVRKFGEHVIATKRGMLYVYDTSNISSPQVLDSIATNDDGMLDRPIIHQFGDKIARVDEDKLELFSFDGTELARLGERLNVAYSQITITGDTLWAVDGMGNDPNAYDISNPNDIQSTTATFAYSQGEAGIGSAGQYLFTSGKAPGIDFGLHLISDPSEPTNLGYLTAVTGGRIMVTDYGVWVGSFEAGMQWITGVPGTLKRAD